MRAGNEQGVKCVTMDLQSVLLCPRWKASALYYKTKLCVHNFTVYDLVRKHCVCYVWNECEGGLTGNEFASCVVDFFTSDLSSNEYVVYSYGCGYQNRNATLASALSYFSKKIGKTITQNILEKGHTQMELGSVHSTIERKLKNRPTHCPADYVSIMRESRQNPQPYDVKYSTHDFLKDFSKVKSLTSIRPGRNKGDSVVTALRAIQYLSDGTIHFKLDFDIGQHSLKARRICPRSSPTHPAVFRAPKNPGVQIPTFARAESCLAEALPFILWWCAPLIPSLI